VKTEERKMTMPRSKRLEKAQERFVRLEREYADLEKLEVREG